jgi:hypothetical protein
MSVFYYFGRILPLAEVTQLMVQYKEKDPYCFILDQGLQYRKVGQIDKTYLICIGRELAIPDTNEYGLARDKIFTQLDDKTYSIGMKHEQEVLSSLLKCGVYLPPHYYAIYNY